MNEKKFNNLYNNIKKDFILYNKLNNENMKKYIYDFINDIIKKIKDKYNFNLNNFNDNSDFNYVFERIANVIIKCLLFKTIRKNREKIINKISEYIYFNLGRIINNNKEINKEIEFLIYNIKIQEYYKFIEKEKLINKKNNLTQEKKNKINDLIKYSINLNIPPEKHLLKYKLNKIIRDENYSTMEDIN